MDKIIIDTIEMYNDYIKRVATGCNEIISNLREEHFAEAFQQISEFAQGTLWIEEVNRLFKLNGIEKYLDIEIIKMELNEINDALQQQDYMLLADLFEYELQPFFSSFNALGVK